MLRSALPWYVHSWGAIELCTTYGNCARKPTAASEQWARQGTILLDGGSRRAYGSSRRLPLFWNSEEKKQSNEKPVRSSALSRRSYLSKSKRLSTSGRIERPAYSESTGGSHDDS